MNTGHNDPEELKM